MARSTPAIAVSSDLLRRLRQWEERGVWLEAWWALLATLDQRGLLRWEKCFMDATFFPAGGSAVGKTKRGKGTKCMVLADGKGIPLGVFWRLPRRTK